MSKFITKIKKPKPVVFIIAGLGLFCAVFNILPRLSGNFAEFYAENIYPIIVAAVGGITGLFPFSLLEMGIYVLALLIIAGIVILTVKLIQGRKKRICVVKKAVTIVLVSGFSLLSILTLNCNINYYRVPFSEISGLSCEDGYTPKQLLYMTKSLILKGNMLAQKITTDQNNLLSLENTDISQVSRCAMTALGQEYPALSGFYPQPKAVVYSEGMSMLMLCGVYSPFTVEANYNALMPAYTIPFTVCHELSHLKGFMREDEANFIAFLACDISDNDAFAYSGYVNAICYSLNALYGNVSDDEYLEVFRSLDDKIKKEIYNKNQYWDKYKSPVAEVYNNFNDTYLKIQSQYDGVKSYGRFVDLLIYQWQENNNTFS